MSYRVVGIVAAVLVAIALATSGCSKLGVGGAGTSPRTSEGSDASSPGQPSPGQSSVGHPTPPHDGAKLRPAATARLPTKLNGWTVNGPVESTANIEAGSYALADKTQLAVVNITRKAGLSARQMLSDMMIDDPQPIGAALCATVRMEPGNPTPSAAPSGASVICLVDLDGGVLNVSGPATVTMAEYAKFANDLYGSFPA